MNNEEDINKLITKNQKYEDYLNSLDFNDLSTKDVLGISGDVYKRLHPIIVEILKIKSGTLTDDLELAERYKAKLLKDISNIEMDDDDRKNTNELIGDVMNISEEQAKNCLLLYYDEKDLENPTR